MKKQDEKPTFGDIIYNDNLVKRTLMASAYPAMIKRVEKDGETSFEGFLPGFEFAEIKDMKDEYECVDYLQDMLDDEVEELVVFGKTLPNIGNDEELMSKYPDYNIVYLDINVYVDKNTLCDSDCSSCSGCSSYEYDDDCDCDDDDCCCCDDDCDCDDDCCCEEEEEDDCGCGDDCCCHKKD